MYMLSFPQQFFCFLFHYSIIKDHLQCVIQKRPSEIFIINVAIFVLLTCYKPDKHSYFQILSNAS